MEKCLFERWCYASPDFQPWMWPRAFCWPCSAETLSHPCYPQPDDQGVLKQFHNFQGLSRAPVGSEYHQCMRSTCGRTPEDRDLIWNTLCERYSSMNHLVAFTVCLADHHSCLISLSAFTRLTFMVCVASPDCTPQRCARFSPLLPPLKQCLPPFNLTWPPGRLEIHKYRAATLFHVVL